MKKPALVFILILISAAGFSQEKRVAFGFEFRPIVPSALFRVSADSVRVDNLKFTISPEPGYSYGAMVTFFLTRQFALETGINYLTRDYTITVEDGEYNPSLRFKADNYEMPLIATLYVRLGKRIYMGHSAGLSMQFLPSHLLSKVDKKDPAGNIIYSLEQVSKRSWWAWPSFRGGIGWEYRTEENGTFYVGPTYLLFTTLYKTRLVYRTNNIDIQRIDVKPIGDFFGITLRYSFPPTPMPVKDKTDRKTGK